MKNCVVIITNANRRHFFRYGLNQDSGHAQTDCIVVDRSGYILSSVLWDFSDVTSAVAYPIDPRHLTLSGGVFTTIANRGESKYNYFDRGIHIRRSNVAVEGITHYIDGEGDEGLPMAAFCVPPTVLISLSPIAILRDIKYILQSVPQVSRLIWDHMILIYIVLKILSLNTAVKII